MKICPGCKSVFANENSFCLNDGTVLVEEPLPTVAFQPPSEIQQDPGFVVSLPEREAEFTPPSVNRTGSSFKKSLLLLIAGLFVGGGLVLALVFFVILQNSRSDQVKPEPTPAVSSGLHNKRNNTRKDSEFNGFVKTENANLRSAPNSSGILDILPQDDRVNMLERDGFWYRVVCEHGVSGWMHGNTLSWASGAVPF